MTLKSTVDVVFPIMWRSLGLKSQNITQNILAPRQTEFSNRLIFETHRVLFLKDHNSSALVAGSKQFPIVVKFNSGDNIR